MVVRRDIRRWSVLAWREAVRIAAKFDIKKPLHLVMVGLILGSIVAPIADWAYTNQQYHLSNSVQAVAEHASPKLMSKLKYNPAKKASVFNADGAQIAKDKAHDQNATSLGASGKKDNQLYTATMPDDASQGIEVSDNVSGVSFKFVPQMKLLGGRTVDGHVVYPLKGQSGHLIFTPKGNGIKEDIVLDSAPEGDAAEFGYRLDLPSSVQARLDEDGSIGFYTGTPELFGNISYGSDKDRELIEKSRANSNKTYLMFKIPAPTIRETGKTTNVMGRFALDKNILTVHVTGLKKAHYPIAIDPTFYITSTTDFILGSIDDNIDLSVADQVGRAAIGGGSTPDWNPTSAPNLTYAQFSAGLVAYNGFLYLIGGGCVSGNCTTVSNDVRYICLNPTTGALGTNGGCTPATWTNTGNSLLNSARQGLVAYGYNGYLYAVGGEDASGVPISAANSVEFAKINTNGTVGTWNYTGHMASARSYMAGATYQGVLYAMGGSSGTLNATPLASTEYARINGDGTIGSCDATTYHTACTWTTSSSFTTARNRFRGAAYNGFVYMGGGRTSTPTVLNDIQYAAIASDGSLGAWQTSTSFPQTRRDLGLSVNNGYIYVYGGSQQAAMGAPTAQMLGDTYYAVINADGTIGQWQKTLQYNYNNAGTDYNPRVPGGTTFYSNHLYFIGGCYVEAASSGNHCTSSLVGTFITSIDSVGRFDKGVATTGSPPYSGTSTVSRMGAKAVALNGYMYYIGGCSAAGCDTYNSTVEYAAINADGSMSNLGTTTALSAGSGNSAGRMGHTLAAYNDKIYVIGGTERTTSGTAGATPTAAAPTTTTFASGTTHNVTMPATVSSGELLLAFFTNDANSTVTTPSGWSRIITGVRTTQATGSVYAKKATGSEGGTTVNFLTNASRAASANVYRVQGWNGDLGGVVANSVDPGGTTAAPNPASLTTSWGSANNLWFAYAAGSTWATTTYPGSYTGGTTSTGGSGTTGASTATAQRAVAAATEDPGAFAMTSAQNGMAFTVAVQPALAHTDSYMSTILSSTQASNGTLGSWGTETNGLTGSASARAFHTTEVWHNYVYVLGGLTSGGAASGNIFYSQIGSSGALGAWAVASTGITARWGHSGGIWGNWLYVVGGQTDTIGTYMGTSSGANAVQQITINPSTGDTSAASGYAVDVARRLGGGYVDRGILYSLGGDIATTGTSASPDVSRAALNSSTGAVGTFSATNIGNIPDNYPTAAVMGLDTARSLTSAVIYEGYSYVLGGCSDALSVSSTKNCANMVSTANTSEVYLPDNGGTGQLSSFSTGGSNIVDLPTVGGTAGRADHATVAYNNKLYVIGGCRVYTAGACTTGLGDIERADIEADGTITSGWTAQTSLPGGEVRSGLKAVAYNGFMYIIGGRSSGAAATGSVWYTTIDNTGTLGGTWSNVSNALNNDIGCPSSCVTRRDFGAAVSGGYLYVVGGVDNGGTRQATVHLASIDTTTGALGAWSTTTSFTTARTDFGFAAYNGVLYVVGGYDGTNTLTDVQYGDIGGGGAISAWKYTTDVAPGARARQAVGANGYMYYLGDESGSNTSVSYASISSVGALGSISTSPGVMAGTHAHGAAVFYGGFIYDTGGCTLSSNVCTTVSAANDKAGQQAVSRTGHYSKLFDTQVDTTPTQLVVGGIDGGPGSLVEFKFQTASSSDPVLGIPQLIRPVIYGQYYNVQSLNSSGAFVGQAFQYQYLITLDDSKAGTFPDVPKSGSQTAVTDVTLYYHANPARRLRHGASFTNNGCNEVAKDGCILDTAP